MIKAKQIFKSYGNLSVLNGIDLEVQKGEVISIVGSSGAGKSTLLHILGTLDNPTSGSIEIKGENVFNLTHKKLCEFRNQNIGFVFQFHNLLPEFDALENVCIPGYIANGINKKTKNRAMELLCSLGLEQRIYHKPSELSGGEQQRVAVARALINSPTLIFADEPSGNLDSKNAQQLHNLFFELRNKMQQTFIIVTHNSDFANMADKKYKMRDGKIIP